MIFNKDNKGNEELRRLTGSYYANNNFAKIEQDIVLAEEELIKIIGRDVFKRAEDHYKNPDQNLTTEQKELEDDLLERVRLPIAIYATFMMYRKNDVSHEDSGRKVKMDPATMEEIFAFSRDLERQGKEAIADFKNERNGKDILFPLLPNNHPRNKYMKV